MAVTGLVAAGGEMFWEMDCSGLQGLGDVWKMALEDFFPHLVDLRILILIYGLRFHGFRGASSAALQLERGPRGRFPPQDAPGGPAAPRSPSPRAAACPGPALPCPVHNQ